MDPLLGLLLASIAFAFFIYLVQRSVRFVVLLGIGVAAVSVLVLLGVVEL